MTRMPAVQRRETIIAAAQKVLLDKGLVAATTRDVTVELGVGVGLLSHYFTWTELRALAFERIARLDLESTLLNRRYEPPADVLREVIANAFVESTDSVWRVWIEATELSSNDRDLAKVVGTCADLWSEGLADLFSQGHALSAWSCADPKGASWRIIALLYGLAGLTLAQGARLSRADATHHLRTAIEHECLRAGSTGDLKVGDGSIPNRTLS